MINSIKSYLKKINQRIINRREGRNATVYKITHDSQGVIINSLTVENESGNESFSWDDVEKVKTFKRDLYTVDLICLYFECKNNKGFEINEEMEGWEELIKQLHDYLPGCKKWEEWFMAVFLPPFAPNKAEIYLKIKEQSNLPTA